MEAFQITNSLKICYSVNIKYLYKLIFKSDKILYLKRKWAYYKFKVESGHEPLKVKTWTKIIV